MIYESFGAAEFPLEVADAPDDAFPDPARDSMLALFAAAINAELREVWDRVKVKTGSLFDRSPVQHTYPGLPTPHLMRERKAEFPCLFLDRRGEVEYSEHTSTFDKKTQQWDLTWALGPLNAGEWKKFSAAAKVWVPDVVSLVIRNRGHSSYQSGAVQFGADAALIDSVRLLNASSDPVPFGGEEGPLFYGCTIRLETIEFDRPNEGAFTELDGANLSLDVGSSGEGLIRRLVNARTN